MHAQEFEAALELTPFSGCKGESLVPTIPSGLLVRLLHFSRHFCASCGQVSQSWWTGAWSAAA